MKKPKKGTLRFKILELLAKEGKLTTREIMRKMGTTFAVVRDKLQFLLRDELVTYERVRRITPLAMWTISYEWSITQKGLEWLKEELERSSSQ